MPKKSVRWAAITVLVVAVIVAVTLYFTLTIDGPPAISDEEYLKLWALPQEKRAKGAVVTNGGPCAEIGMKILQKYGNAIDSAIAAMICDGVTCMHNMGIGGGFIATIFIKKENKVITLNARESAPAAATESMFVANKSLSYHGGLAVAVPGEIRGYWEMYHKYGGAANWSELFVDTIKLCEEGVPINVNLGNNINLERNFIMNTPGLRDILLNEKGELPKYGDKIKLPKIAKTLKVIAEEGPESLYNGSLTAGLLKDIKMNGGIITEEDLSSYRALWEEPVFTELSSGDKLYSTPLPGSGPIVAFLMKVLDGQLPSKPNDLNTTFMITEAFKFAYSLRSQLGDPHFLKDTSLLEKMQDMNYINYVRSKLNVPKTSNDIKYYGANFFEEDHGTANIVVFAPNGDAIAATSTVNTIFGSGVVSESTGIILNNEMDDFSTPGLVNFFGVPPSSANFIAPNKRPLSSMCPVIVLDKNGDVKLAIGAAGGTKITTATVLTMIWNMWYNMSIADSVYRPRFHHQLMPMVWDHEATIDDVIVKGMQERGHKEKSTVASRSCVTAIRVKGDLLGASSDMRRPGNTSYLEL